MADQNGKNDEKDRMDSILDAALDALGDDEDDDDDDDDDEHEHEHENVDETPKNAAKSRPTNNTMKKDPKNVDTKSAVEKEKPIIGPPRPPPAQPAISVPAGPQPPPIFEDDAEKLLAGFMEDMMKSEENPEVFMSMIRQMEAERQQQQQHKKKNAKKKKSTPSSQKQVEKVTAKTNSKNKDKDGNSNAEVKEAISNLLEGVTASPREDSNIYLDDDENEMDAKEEEAILQSLLQGFQNLSGGGGGGLDANALMDGMMEQLMSKELMYEPMKQVAEKFPDWLEQNQALLSPKEYAQRKQQHLIFQKIVQIYQESEPPNTRKLVECMQQVQEFGQPPKEIIHEIAPGLELDADGVPKFDFLGNPDLMKEECSIL